MDMDNDTTGNIEDGNSAVLSSPLQERETRLIEELKALKSEVRALKKDLHRSECLRTAMKMKMRSLEHRECKFQLADVLNLDCTRILNANGDDNFGMLWNLSEKISVFKSIDEHLSRLNHARRKSDEHPIVTISETGRDTVSYPIWEHIKSTVGKAKDGICFDCDVIGHVGVNGENEIEISSGFAGVKGNLLWLNTGDISLTVRLVTGVESRLLLIRPGFGLCWGKRDKHTRVFLSCPLITESAFSKGDSEMCRGSAIFFGISSGIESLLDELNVENPSILYKQPNFQNQRNEVVKERNRRLGIEPINNRINSIRIAPMKGSELQPGMLAKKVDCFRDWITSTLLRAKLSSVHKGVSIVPSLEKPRDGDRFEVLWAEFKFEQESWDDQVMWDIRYLLMGSKLGRIPGFPAELEEIREKIYISRDGYSERDRRMVGF